MRFKQKQPVIQTAINNALSGGGGGGGGTTDYTELENKPQINSVTLSGNKTTSDLGIDEVPEVTSEDNAKVLTATYSEGTGSYAWATASSGGTTDYTDLSNKPSINGVTLSGNKTTSDLDIDEVPTITSSDNGKVLRANYYVATSTSDYSWESIPEEIPQVTSVDDGKVLTASYNSGTSTGSYNWATPSGGGNEVPTVTSNDDGKVLKATYNAGSGTYSWADLGLTVGSNYIQIGNGPRLYISDSAPTGDIPNGSLGIGFYPW